MSAIFGFTFHMGRMPEVLTPDIYRKSREPIFIFVERKKHASVVAKMNIRQENTKMMHRYSLSSNNMM